MRDIEGDQGKGWVTLEKLQAQVVELTKELNFREEALKVIETRVEQVEDCSVEEVGRREAAIVKSKVHAL